jgi:phosphoglycolate phosphatase-like HAD superfamily hydrolase
MVTGGTLRQQQLAAAATMAGVPTLAGAAYDAWSEAFSRETLRQKPQLFPDVMPALRALKKKGAYLAISSSMPQADLDESMEKHHDIKKLLDLTLGTRNNGSFRKGKPHLSAISELTGTRIPDIFFVGDMPEDIRRGKEAKAITIARLPPNSPQLEEQIHKLKPDYTITSFNELLKLI